MLHITNGESANHRLEAASIPGSFLSWDDPLHHGPAPEGLSLREMSEIRAGFIADNSWASLDEAQRRFRQRDETLHEVAREDQVVLWSSFELFDQLHLLQILSWFERYRQVVNGPEVIWVRDYLGGGDQDDDEIRTLFMERVPISEPQIGTAAAIWQAFTASNPTALSEWHQRGLRELPFMQRALERQLQEYPWLANGLARTHYQILQVVEPGPLSAAEIFATTQALESRRFMGDWSFWIEFSHLMRAETPPLRELDGQPIRFPPEVQPDSPEFRELTFELTDFGRSLLADEASFQPVMRGERWIGGVRIDRNSPWFWDPERNTLAIKDRRVRRD